MKSITGTHHISSEHPELLKDESSLSGGNCQTAAWPENERDSSLFFKECSEDSVQVTVSGARTGIAGGAVPMGGAVLSTEKLKGILPGIKENIITVKAGETLDSVAAFCTRHRKGWFYPPDPTETTASIGGTIATNASGASSYKYGSTRKWINRLSVILPSGTQLSIDRGEYSFHNSTLYHPVLGRLNLPVLDTEQPPKNAAGLFIKPDMDLIDLFIGSQGELGLISEADLILQKKPYAIASFAVFCNEEQFWELREDLLGSKLAVRELEAMVPPCLSFLRENTDFESRTKDEWVLITSIEASNEEDLDSILEALDVLLEDRGISPDNTWGGFDDSERHKLKEFRHLLPETVNRIISGRNAGIPEIHKVSTDTAVPVDKLKTHYSFLMKLLNNSGIEHVVFGHCGQGHLHANLLPGNIIEQNEAIRILELISGNAVSYGGTVSAEHGTGKLKASLLKLMYSSNLLEHMKLLADTIRRA